MPESSTTPAPMPTFDAAALRIVLFGMPDAGKSSLLGALAQAAKTQEHLLNGHLTALSSGLAELQHRVYDDKPRETLEEVVPYAVAFEPFATRRPGKRSEAVLVDCDGRVANELITRRRALTAESEKGSLAQAILGADSLLLVVDASANPSQVDADFAEFGRFLRLLEQSRGRRSDVGGLPVFLVLAKCDLLAQPGDTPAAWMARIEERKRQVDARFQAFLACQKREGPLPFGRIDLHLWATAVKRPPLAGVPAEPRQPYGVAELFRRAFALARTFQQRRSRSGRRLVWTVGGGIGLVLVMIALLAGLLVNRPHEEPGVQQLIRKIDSYRALEAPTPSSRLRKPLQRKISELADLKTDAQFSRLPQEERDYVQTRLQELEDYLAYDEKLQELPGIERLHSEQDLQKLEDTLAGLAVPAKYQPDWNQTEAALFRARLLADIKAVRSVTAQMEDWFSALTRRGQELWTFAGTKPGAPLSWKDWNEEVQTLLTEADAPPHVATDKLPQSSITYGTVLQMDRVAAARASWESIRRNLERVRDLALALGLSGTLAGRSPLDLPAGFQADQAAGRLQELQRIYPRFPEEFQLSDLPEAIIPEIRQAARKRYEHAVKAGQEVVLRHLREVSAGGRESPESWRRLQPWLSNPDDLKAWRVLANILARLQDPAALDPIGALDAFVRRERFDIRLKRVTVEIPDDLKVRPAGNFMVHHFSGDDKRVHSMFEPTGEEWHDARRHVTRYRFQSASEISLIYQPGDVLWPDLAVQNAGAPGWMLTWARNRSDVYQFERFLEPPRLHPKEKVNTQGEFQGRISLEISPEGGIPKVPDLLPQVAE